MSDPMPQPMDIKIPNPEDLTNPKFMGNLYTYVLPLIISIVFEKLQMILSVTFQIYYYPTEAILNNIPFQTAFFVFSIALPSAFSYNLSARTLIFQIENNLEARKNLISSYYFTSVFFSIVFLLLISSWSSVQVKLFSISPDYAMSYILHNIFGPICTMLNAAMVQRYLMEQRIVIAFCSSALNTLFSLAIEQFLFFSQFRTGQTKGNINCFYSYIISNIIFISWQIFLILGHTAYGFKVRNVQTITLKDMYTFSRDKIKLAAFELFVCLPKFTIDITLPITILASFCSISSSFSTKTLIFDASCDLYVYYFIFSIVQAIPNAFARSHFVFTVAVNKYEKYALQKQIMYKTIINALICTAAPAGVIYFLAREFCQIFIPVEQSEEFQNYLSEEFDSGQFAFATALSLIMYVLDIIPQVVTNYLVVDQEYLLVYIQAGVKLVVMALSIMTISGEIGDKANYLYVIMYTEGVSVAVSLVYIVLIEVKFALVYKKKGGGVAGSSGSKKK